MESIFISGCHFVYANRTASPRFAGSTLLFGSNPKCYQIATVVLFLAVDSMLFIFYFVVIEMSDKVIITIS